MQGLKATGVPTRRLIDQIALMPVRYSSCNFGSLGKNSYIPEWGRRRRAAPFKRNDRMLKTIPKGALVFSGNGIQDKIFKRLARWGSSSGCPSSNFGFRPMGGRTDPLFISPPPVISTRCSDTPKPAVNREARTSVETNRL